MIINNNTILSRIQEVKTNIYDMPGGAGFFQEIWVNKSQVK